MSQICYKEICTVRRHRIVINKVIMPLKLQTYSGIALHMLLTIIIRPQHMHAVQRCSLLLQMSVCVLGIQVSCAKTAEPMEMSFGRQTRGTRNHALDKGRDQVNPITASRGDKTAMLPLPITLDSLLLLLLLQKVSAAADRPVRRGASRPPCYTQMWMVSVINW